MEGEVLGSYGSMCGVTAELWHVVFTEHLILESGEGLTVLGDGSGSHLH